MTMSVTPTPPVVEQGPDACPAHTDDDTRARTRELLDRLGDKWSVHVLFALTEGGVLRFTELRRRVTGISQRVLTVTLRGLERDGLVVRTIHPEVPPRVEYALTSLGETLRGMVYALKAWSAAHAGEVDAARARYDRATVVHENTG